MGVLQAAFVLAWIVVSIFGQRGLFVQYPLKWLLFHVEHAHYFPVNFVKLRLGL